MWTSLAVGVLTVLLVLVCAFMILVILMQRSKQEGLGAAFGSGMTDSVFGAQTTNVLQTITVWCAVLFFGITLALSAIDAAKVRRGSAVRKEVERLAAASTNGAPTGASAQAGTETNAAPATNAPVEGAAEQGTNAPTVSGAPDAGVPPAPADR